LVIDPFDSFDLAPSFAKAMEGRQGKLSFTHDRCAQDEYEKLTTTRRRQLDKPLNRIEDIRKQRCLPVASDEGDDSIAIDEQSDENANDAANNNSDNDIPF